jgi:hypothetical protein
MHPDYLGYGGKIRVRSRAQWFDVKFLCKKVAGYELGRVYVWFVNYGNWYGWFVEFDFDVELSAYREAIYGVLVVGKRCIYIGVNDA